ncbi:peptidoglycan/LPS O-acetylase OafA/YrhL [Pseudarthrobacter niigatensis]|uniref:Peptidoglycan/LPS O-acetylase OafA/YrhL n=1 Tax=Pseudarthrobacter niigatensis TaxID=369935 RepID=A0AAJ1SXG4_9MICC|nr:peptidoglycan/LPS O-acetylase OafA/YrhL [Pseudarthrobacter niigatensis]MDQ0264180.1 peptidoglycan/LPS O-acetylase OafA/YrhL [Pseudarthrobacter niigatensis]
MNLHDEKGDVLRDSVLLLGTSSLNSPLWSLQWEIVFSLLLPLFVVAAIWFRRFWVIAAMALIMLIGLADLINVVGPAYLPIFGVGVLMAARRDRLHAWATKLNSRSWGLLFVASLMLLNVHWVAPPFLMARAVAALGGAVLVFVFIGSKLATSFGKGPAVQWLGTRSFSLYLVHEPVVMAIAFGLRITDPLLVVAIAMPASFVLAEGFFRLMERPCHRLSVIVGRFATKWAGPTQQRLVTQR